uniref:Coiled-coil domain containing 148 n=2 Tax=Nothobranchius TaxID=28779 RepID=A0A1A8R1D6_9TELE
MKNGLGSSRYKPAEYERLQAIVEAKRMELDLIGQKVQKSRCAAKATKESSLLQQHRQVWSKERTRLQKAEKQAKDGLHHFLDQIRPNDATDTAIFSLQEYELFLEREREASRKDTVDPVYQLRDDLRSRLGKMQHQQLNKYPSNWEPVKEQVLERRDQERLAALRSIMEEQARRDRQRVQFRADVLQQRRKEREELELERQREEQDKQNRLEALRKQVEVVAEADLERMMGDTEAWKSRHLNENELQKPLYSLSTYTDTQILSDPRVRLEQALREAGLQQSQYSKAVLSEVKPPKPPRRDTESTLKF